MEEQLLKEYVGTYLNPKYNGDWDVINSKFPELSGVDKELLKEYVGTYLNPKYNGDWNIVNSKFPELFPAGKASAERPMAVQPKKKEDTTALPSGVGSSASSALTPDPEALRFAELVKKQGEVVGKRRDEPSYIDPRKTLGMYPTKEQADKATAQAMADINVTTGERKEPEKKGGKSYLENIALNLGLGASYANEAFLSIPESVVNLLAIPQNYIAEKTGLPIGVTAEGIKESWGITNPLLDYAKEGQKVLGGEVSKFMAERYEDPSIKGNFEKGNYREGFELLGSAITQSLPTSVGLMIGGAYTAPSKLATVATLGFTEDQREELAAMDPTMSEAEKTLKAAGMAAMESVFSSIGTGTLGKVYKDIAKREGVDAAKNILKDGLIIAYETALKKGGLPVAVAGNSLEEGAVRLSQNVISGRPIMDGVIDAFITGGGSGVVFGAPISAVNAKRYIENKITSYDTKSKVTEILKDKADNMAQVYNVPVSSEITTSQLEISNLPNSRNLLVNNLKKSVSDGQITEEDAKQSLFVFDKIQQVSNAVKDLDVSQEDKARIATLLRQRDDLRTKIQNKDDVLVVQEKRQIEDINNQIQEILSAPKQEAASYKVDGKDVTVKAIDELIKTKSKEELLAMNIEVNNDQSGVAERLQAAIETKPIQQDAIQEQAAGQVPVQPGTGVSQEVAQGEPQAEPQITPEESIQEEIIPEVITGEVVSPEVITEDVSLTDTDFDEEGDLTDEGFTKSENYLKSIIEEEANNAGIPVDILLKHYNINSRGEYFSSTTPILQVSESNNYQRAIKTLKDISFRMFPDKIDELNTQINNYSQELLDGYERGDKGTVIDKSHGKLISALDNINDKFNQFINPTTQEGQVQEEVTPTQEELDLETQLAEDLDVIKSETKPRLRVDGIDIPAEEDINLETIEMNLDRLPAYEVNFTTPEVSQDIQVNPIEESKSSTKDGTAESRPIEYFQGMPMIVGMSDTLAAGTVVDSMGNPMEIEGGLLYNVLGKNKNAAWAGVTEQGALTQYNEALDTYNKNKELYEKLWAEGKLPNGHVPMAIMRMSDTAINSNEAVFRYLLPLVKSQPEANQKAALNALKSDIERKKITDKENLIKFISKNNIDSLGKLFDAVIADAKARAKGDIENTLSLTDRSNLFDLIISPQGIKSASKNPVKELFGFKKDPRSTAFLADNIYEAIGEPAMLRIPRGNVAAVVGIDVLNGGVIPVEHGNYGFGPKGQMIALISNPKHGLDVFPEWKAKAVRVFKKTKTKEGEGKLPTATEIADQVGGAFFMDKAFRNARVDVNPSDVDILAAKLRFAFPDVTVSRTKEEFDRVLQEEGVRTKESEGKVILGMTKDGKIYLNPESDSLATPIHEFGHIWIDFLKSKASGKKGDALLSKGLSLVEGTRALQQAIAKYGDNALAREEALVELMATKGETIINKSKKKEFMNWLNSLFKYVKEFFITSEQFFKGTDFEQRLKEITLDDFINIGLADLLKGEAVSSKFKAKEAADALKTRSSKVQRLAPNGKPSNLNEAQWNQVRTPEFKKWFGDWENDPENASKVVDENGEPLVMYHGSPSVDIESFDINKAVRQKSGLREFANYFTSNKKLADLYRKAPLSKEYKNEIENLLREAKEKRSESRSNATWNFYTQEIDRLNSIFEGKIYEVFLNVKSPFEFNGGNLDMKGWDNASLDIGYKNVTGKAEVIEALSGNNSAYKNTEYDGLIATNLADMFYGTTDKVETRQAVKDLTGTVVAVWDPKQIKSATENVGTFDTGTSNIRFRVGDSIQSFINKARAQGYSEEAIKNVLTRSGVDADVIDTALGKVEPAAKKVEVTEEFAPGYNRVLNNIFGIIAKSRERNRPEEGTLENAINYLGKTRVYINATDVQREAMVRNLRKEFKKREKAAPSAEKVVGKPKKKEVTVDEMAALKDQIKLEARAAREAKGDLNTKRKALAARIISARKKGTITAVQARALVNRISKVNLDNPIMVDRLLEYTDKVFDNANYAAEMDEIRKLQAQAKSRNHTSMTNVVKQFTSINPENIPLDRIQDYKEALDFLNNRTPFYGNMNDIFDEMLSYQISEEFDAIKTMEALEKKYEDIMSNQVKNVEDYVNLIKDINSFKRKAFQLLQNEEITQGQYDELIKMVGEDQQTIEENYKDEITKIKKDLIAEIKNQRPKVSRDFSNVENDLIRKYLELSDADLENLSPEDLFVLNDLLDNISNGEIDNFRFNEIISKAYTSDGANRLAKQIDDSKFDMTPEEGTKELSEYESSFWEGLLGMGRAKSGALQKFVVSVFNRAIASYENLTRDGYNKFLKIKDEYKMSDKDMHKIGMLTTYLQEYMAQFDPKNEGIKDIGKRDWFKEILNSKSMRGKYSSGKPSILKVVGLGKSEIDIIEEIWDSLPKDKDGNVDPKAVYDSYMANDGKFFTKNQKGFFDDIMDYKASEITPKQKFANEINGASFKEIPFHMMRVRLDGGRTQITPTASSDNGVVRIKAGTGKERVSEAVGPIMTNFEKLFITNLEQTGRDYFLSGALKDINNTLSGAKKKIDPDKMPILDTISGTLSEALGYEFDRTQSNFIFRNLLSARAAMTLLRPIRTVTELGSTLLSYPVRAKTLSGYKSLFGEQGAMKKLLEFTNSPMLLRDNINKAIDINDGRIEPQSRFTKATNYLSGLPERTMMITSWMPTFKSEFKNSTGIDFDINKFNTSEVYREKYGKAIREASAAADAQTEKIIGPTVKAGQRREVRIAPKVLANIIGLEGTVPKNSAAGQILGFFSNYPYREVTEFINGFKEAAEVIKDEGALSSLSQLQKPLGIALNVAAYGFLGTLTYAGQLILLGDEDDEERGIKLLKDIMTTEGLLNELASNAISLAGSKYAAGGKALLQLAATIAIESTDDEEQKAKIKKLLKDSVFVDPLPVEQAAKFGGRDKALSAIAMYIPQFVIFADRYADFIGGINEFEAIYDKVESKGVESLTQDEGTKILALNTIINASQILLNVFGGTSLPEYNNIKTYMKKLKEEAGVADVYKGESLAKKKSSGGGGGGRAKTMNKSDLKKYFPEQYNELYGEGSATYEIEQEVKAFEKEQREMKKRIKDQVYGGKD